MISREQASQNCIFFLAFLLLKMKTPGPRRSPGSWGEFFSQSLQMHTVFTVFAADLPSDAREGSLLRKEQGRFILAPEEEKARRAKMFALQEKLRGKNADGRK